MTDMKLANQLKKEILKLKDEGHQEVNANALLDYLEDIEEEFKHNNELNAELYKAKLQNWAEEHKNKHQLSQEMFRSVITAGQNALRTSFLMNGGASVAMLAFMGNLATKSPDKVQLFAYCITLFVFGVLISSIISGATYLSQWFYASDKKWTYKVGFSLNVIGIVLGICSYMIFAYGIKEAYDVFVIFK